MESRSARILIVDDESSITEFVSYALSKEGYRTSVAKDGEEALAIANGQDFDLYILDILLPGIDGYELCRRIRTKSDAPILFLSACDTESDTVKGLEIGADDYLTKPFGIRELTARVHALLRRANENKPSGIISVSGITVNTEAHTVEGTGGKIDLTPREFELLSCLIRNAGNVVSREELLHEAWDWDYITETKTVDTHVKRLRDKIESAGSDPSVIETVRGYGYRFRK